MSSWPLGAGEFRDLCGALRRHHPLVLRVRALRKTQSFGAPTTFAAGSHILINSVHHITVDPGLDRIATTFVLFHEWAHALDIEDRSLKQLSLRESHPDSFWGFYGLICKRYTDIQEALDL